MGNAWAAGLGPGVFIGVGVGAAAGRGGWLTTEVRTSPPFKNFVPTDVGIIHLLKSTVWLPFPILEWPWLWLQQRTCMELLNKIKIKSTKSNSIK